MYLIIVLLVAKQHFEFPALIIRPVAVYILSGLSYTMAEGNKNFFYLIYHIDNVIFHYDCIIRYGIFSMSYICSPKLSYYMIGVNILSLVIM